MFTEATLQVLITTVGGIVIAYIVNVISKRRASAKTPESGYAHLIQGYDTFNKKALAEIDRKEQTVTRLEAVIDTMEQDLETTRRLLNETRMELAASKQQNQLMQRELESLKAKYERSTKS